MGGSTEGSISSYSSLDLTRQDQTRKIADLETTIAWPGGRT